VNEEEDEGGKRLGRERGLYTKEERTNQAVCRGSRVLRILAT